MQKCGRKGHSKERCWLSIGYPHWHPKAKDFPQKKTGSTSQRGPGQYKNQGNNQRGYRGKEKEIMTAHVDANANRSDGKNQSMTFTQQQIEQLLRLLPQSSKSVSHTSDGDEDFDHNFAGNILCSCVSSRTDDWTLDTGATDHMTPYFNNVILPKQLLEKPKINLPTGHTSDITHIGTLHLHNDLVLHDLLYVPAFKFNLLSVPKLIKDSSLCILPQILLNTRMSHQDC